MELPGRDTRDSIKRKREPGYSETQTYGIPVGGFPSPTHYNYQTQHPTPQLSRFYDNVPRQVHPQSVPRENVHQQYNYPPPTQPVSPIHVQPISQTHSGNTPWHSQSGYGDSNLQMYRPSPTLDSTIVERPVKRAEIDDHHAASLKRLTSNQYLYMLREFETKLKSIRALLLQRDLQHLGMQLAQLRGQFDEITAEFESLKDHHFLVASDFKNLLSLEEFLTSTLYPQLSIYEADFNQLTDPMAQSSTPVNLTIVCQETSGPIPKDKVMGSFTLRVLTSSLITQIQSGPVQLELVQTSQRVKKSNQDMESSKQNFRENGTAVFSDLKFSSGTFPHMVRLKFWVSIQIVQNGQHISKTIESPPTKPFISMTNTGSQWKDAAGSWLKEDCFTDDAQQITIARLWNYFQYHYLTFTKQSYIAPKRPLTQRDFEYMLNAKFEEGLNKGTIDQKEFQLFWDWIGPGLKRVRYQKHLLWLFENGYLACFVTGSEATAQLKNEIPGTFIVRFSERLSGEFVISYAHASGVRHYLVQPGDISDKKRTFVDFLGQKAHFVYILQVCQQSGGKTVWIRHDKDKILERYYKKEPKQPEAQATTGTPYDTKLPS